MDTVNITFLGASQAVTGSKFLLETPELTLMIDCGMFQGVKELREHNWKKLPIEVDKIDYVLLTHGHLDHVGYLPKLVNQGFKGSILSTQPSLAITEIILTDSAKIHEEEALKANKENYSKHQPALPLYTSNDVKKTCTLFKSIIPNEWIQLSEHIQCRFQPNGHIIGSCFIELDIFKKRFVFSGDLGRRNDYLLPPPNPPKWADYLFLESTYGNKLHPNENPEDIIIQLAKETIYNNGNLIIPCFAVERLQTILYILWKLYKKNKIAKIPIYIDSPMGNNVLEIFKQFPNWHKLSSSEYQAMYNFANIIQSYRETWETIDNPRSKIIVAGSGMLTGGRVLTYLQQYIDRKNTTILLVGYQAEGTRGRQLLDGAHEIKFFGKYYPVKARVKNIDSLSAHADQNDLLNWIDNLKNIPETTFLIHGEPTSLEALRVKISDNYSWKVICPKLFQQTKIIL